MLSLLKRCLWGYSTHTDVKLSPALCTPPHWPEGRGPDRVAAADVTKTRKCRQVFCDDWLDNKDEGEKKSLKDTWCHSLSKLGVVHICHQEKENMKKSKTVWVWGGRNKDCFEYAEFEIQEPCRWARQTGRWMVVYIGQGGQGRNDSRKLWASHDYEADQSKQITTNFSQSKDSSIIILRWFVPKSLIVF